MAQNKKGNKAVTRKPDRTIQYIGIGLIVVVAAFFIWKSLSITETNSAVTVEGTPACGIFDSIPAAKQYLDSPAVKINKAKQYFAAFTMAGGDAFVVQLYPAHAPLTVNSFVFLSCKGFYDGVTFHRVIDGFMAQGGDPTGTGTGGPGYRFIDEHNNLTFDKAGVMAMANSGPNTNGSQFFITFAPANFLNGGYTIFGQVIEGMDVVNAITRRDPDQSPLFKGDVIESVTITEK